jgi:hypothetical protein
VSRSVSRLCLAMLPLGLSLACGLLAPELEPVQQPVSPEPTSSVARGETTLPTPPLFPGDAATPDPNWPLLQETVDRAVGGLIDQLTGADWRKAERSC